MNGTEIVAIQQRSLTPEVNDLRTLNRQLSHFFCHPNFSATAGICIICTESHPVKFHRELLVCACGCWWCVWVGGGLDKSEKIGAGCVNKQSIMKEAQHLLICMAICRDLFMVRRSHKLTPWLATDFHTRCIICTASIAVHNVPCNQRALNCERQAARNTMAEYSCIVICITFMCV